MVQGPNFRWKLDKNPDIFDGRRMEEKMMDKCRKCIENRCQIHAQMHQEIDVKRGRKNGEWPSRPGPTEPRPP